MFEMIIGGVMLGVAIFCAVAIILTICKYPRPPFGGLSSW